MIYTRQEIIDLVKKSVENTDITEVYLFGSYARNEATDSSDLDFVVDTDDSMQVFQFIVNLTQNSGNLRLDVDVIKQCDINKIFPHVKQNIEKEQIRIL